MTSIFKSKNTLERAFDAVLGHELRKLNTHLPKQRRTLSDLLKTMDPTIEAIDGSSILMKTSELQDIAKIVPTEYQDQLKLPIIVHRRMELGKSIYTVAGDRIEEFTVKKILGITNQDYRHMYRDQDPTCLYRPQVSELISKFHSLIVIGFGIPKELSNYDLSRD